MPDRILTSHQVADLLQVSPSTVLSWISQGRLRCFRTPGGHRRIHAGELREFLRAHSMPVPAPLSSDRHRLLAIDDEPIFLRSLRRQLARSAPSLEVATADSAIEGLLKVGTFRPNVVLIDGYMPGIDGVEVCRRLRDDPQTADIAVIALTGRPSGELVSAFRAAGALAVLAKPLDENELLYLLSRDGLLERSPEAFR